MKRVRPLLPATAGPVHCPRLVMLDQVVKNLLRRQALVNVDHGGHVAEVERLTDVCLFVRDADGPCHSLRAVRRRKTQAVFTDADVQVSLHSQFPRKAYICFPHQIRITNSHVKFVTGQHRVTPSLSGG